MYGKSCFSSATGVEPAPETEPVIVRPLPQIGRIVDGVIATPVGAFGVVKVRLLPRVTPAALVATARKLYLVLGLQAADRGGDGDGRAARADRLLGRRGAVGRGGAVLEAHGRGQRRAG